jgi:DNA-binding beta-propeller fold protein YncE
VPDYHNYCLQKFSEFQNGTLFEVIGASGELEGELDNPHSVDVDSEGYIYVSDVNNHRIQKFSVNGDFISTFGNESEGNGQFIELEGIDVDSEGNIYVVDTGKFRIQVFSQE